MTRSKGCSQASAWANAMAETFFATLTTEFYHRVLADQERGQTQVGAWIGDRYRRRRRHLPRLDHTVAFELQYSK